MGPTSAVDKYPLPYNLEIHGHSFLTSTRWCLAIFVSSSMDFLIAQGSQQPGHMATMATMATHRIKSQTPLLTRRAPIQGSGRAAHPAGRSRAGRLIVKKAPAPVEAEEEFEVEESDDRRDEAAHAQEKGPFEEEDDWKEELEPEIRQKRSWIQGG